MERVIGVEPTTFSLGTKPRASSTTSRERAEWPISGHNQQSTVGRLQGQHGIVEVAARPLALLRHHPPMI